MKAVLLEKSRTVLSENAFFEVVLWHLPDPVPGSSHPFKYRLAVIVSGDCVLREEAFRFTTLEGLFEAFEADIERIVQ